MTDDPDHSRRKQVRYRANHRGIKEMDILLGGYADKNYLTMAQDELLRFEEFLAEHDRDLIRWFTSELPLPEHLDKELFDAILAAQSSVGPLGSVPSNDGRGV